jgi:serine/threonine protein kinase
MNPAADPTTSEQFGPYQVYERLGLGGMATVYRAKKRGPAGFERSVALKRMLSHLAEDPAFVESFIREAKLASLLQHPNVAQVYDFGRISGVYYIAMELVAGFDIRKLLRYANRANEAIPMPVILSILGELCDALDYAHTFVDEAGQPLHIVHRDVSPSNLIVAHTGHLKVIDFGIAKASSRQLHTESGQVKGKLGYMSPEVALGLPVGPVADMFSVGVVAWELVTASPLFSARTDYETMRKIREEPIAPPSRLNPACPSKLDQVILAALEREPEQRLASARLFRNVLDQIAAEASTQVSARSVAEWMLKFVQPEDSWARAATSQPRHKTPSGRALPLPPADPPTAVIRTRAATPLRRSPDDIKLASEIWGDDARTLAEPPGPRPDFHHNIAVPPQGEASGIKPPLLAPPRTTRKPLLVLSALALVAIALAAILFWKHRATPTPLSSVRFEISPAGAQVMIADQEIGHRSPLDTKLAPGTYAMSVELDGYKPYTSTITIRQGDQQTIRVALDREDTVIAIDEPAPPDEQVAKTEPDKQVAKTEPDKQVAKTEPDKQVADDKQVAKDEDKPIAKAESDKRVVTAREDKRVTPKTTKTKKVQLAESPKVETPKLEPKVEPPPIVEPPKPAEPPKPVDTKPARTPVVQASAVTKLSGEVPTLHAKNAEGSGDVLAKLCIDEQGKVASVKVVKSNPEIVSELQTALASWRYKPYLRDSKPTPVCFPLSLRVVVKSS